MIDSLEAAMSTIAAQSRFPGENRGLRRWESPRRVRRGYHPEAIACLEERLLLASGLTAQRGLALPQMDRAPLGEIAGRSDTPAAPVVRLQLAGSAALDPRHHGLNPSVYRDVTYTSAYGRREQLDVYVPAGHPPSGGWPVILAIHGGGWRRFDKRDYGRRIASAFVPNGYAVVAPNYPLSSPGHPTWPVNLLDVQAAVRWVRMEASKFTFDSTRIVAMGESAGANLANLLGSATGAAFAGTGSGSASVAAIVGFSTPADLISLSSESPAASVAIAQFLGGPPSTDSQNYVAASPADQVSHSTPPTLLIHGASDTLVPPAQAQILAAALTRAGVPYQVIMLPGAGHKLNFPINTPRNLVFQILAFLDATWKDSGSQSLNT
jgi:acetyl esterase/lipase